MEFQEEYVDLPMKFCFHNDWKVRLFGYQKAFEIFLEIDEGKSNKWDSFIEVLKEFVTDENPRCQMKGLLAVLIFVKKCDKAAKTTKDVVSGILNNCLESEQICIITLAIDIILGYIKIGQREIVYKELIDFLTEPNSSNNMCNCLLIIDEAIKYFGIRAVELECLIEVIAHLMQAENKKVQLEASELLKQLAVWATPELLEIINRTLESYRRTAFQEKFDKTMETPENSLTASERNGTKVQGILPILNKSTNKLGYCDLSGQHTVFENQEIRNTEILEADVPPQRNETDNHQINNTPIIVKEPSANATTIFKENSSPGKKLIVYVENPLYLIDSFKKEFYVKEKDFSKWFELENVVRNILFTLPNDNDCTKWIESIIHLANRKFSPDICCTSVKCVTFCANALKSHFEPCIPRSINMLFHKFEEKHCDLTDYARECMDSIFECTNLKKLQNTLLSSIQAKSRQTVVKLEVHSFLVRCFSKSKDELKKNYMKAYYSYLTLELSNQHFNVRDSAIKALGTAMSIVGQKSFEPYLTHLQDFMLSKIRNYAKGLGTNNSKTSLTSLMSCCELPNEYEESSLIEDKILNKTQEESFTEIGEIDFDEYIPSNDVESYTDSELSVGDEEVIDDNSLVLGFWDDDWGKASDKVLEEDESSLLLIEEEVNEAEGLPCECAHGNDNIVADLIYVKQLERFKIPDRKFGGKEMNMSDLNHSERKNCICMDELSHSSTSIVPRNAPRVREKRRLRISGNEVRDKLLMNLFRKYNFQMGGVPRGIKYSRKVDTIERKHQLNIPERLIQSLSDKDLNSRILSLERIKFLLKCTSNPIDSCSPSLQKASSAIAERICDGSLEIAVGALRLLESLISAMGSDSERYIRTLAPPVLRAVGDPRPGMQVAALLCIKQWQVSCGAEKLLSASTIAEVERDGSWAQRQELWRWVGVALLEVSLGSITHMELIALLSRFYRYLCLTCHQLDEDAIVAFLGFLRHLQPDDLVKACRKNVQIQQIVKSFIEKKNEYPSPGSKALL